MMEKQQELEHFTQDFIRNFQGLKAGETRTIPVHVIVVYSKSQENISQAQIESQIAVLNEDSGGTNSDLNNTPSEFVSVTSIGSGIQFVLDGIERHSDNTSSWGTNDAVKYAYPPNSPETKLNMWICNIGDGICCSYGSGNYSLTDASGAILANGASFGSSESTNFTLSTGKNTIGIVRSDLAVDENRIYPNPVTNTLNIHLVQGYVINTEIISLNGQIIERSVNGNKVDVSDLEPGFYFINVYTNKKVIRTQFIKE